MEDHSVLVVEDCLEIQQAYMRVLKMHGYTATGVATLRDALVALRPEVWRERPFDIILSDLLLPDGDALPVIKQAVRLDPAPVVAVFTGYLDAAWSLTLAQLGVLYAPKPIGADQLKSVLAYLEEQREGLLGAYARKRSLSARETEALRHALERRSLPKAAELMGISSNTLKRYWMRIFDKTGLRSQEEVVRDVRSTEPREGRFLRSAG